MRRLPSVIKLRVQAIERCSVMKRIGALTNCNFSSSSRYSFHLMCHLGDRTVQQFHTLLRPNLFLVHNWASFSCRFRTLLFILIWWSKFLVCFPEDNEQSSIALEFLRNVIKGYLLIICYRLHTDSYSYSFYMRITYIYFIQNSANHSVSERFIRTNST